MSAEIIFNYFPNLDSIQKDKFEKIGTIYREWNQKINVISRKDIDKIYIHHILHSLAITRIISFSNGSTVLDVGTGGGFPGIPLAIMFPEVKFHLIDSIAKKIKVVEEAANSLALQNVSFEQARVEKLKYKYDYIVSRAVTNFPDFINLIKRRFNQDSEAIDNGLYYLKGGDFDEEIARYKRKIKIYTITDMFTESFFETKKIIYYKPI